MCKYNMCHLVLIYMFMSDLVPEWNWIELKIVIVYILSSLESSYCIIIHSYYMGLNKRKPILVVHFVNNKGTDQSVQSAQCVCYSLIVSYLKLRQATFEPWHEISNNVVCATSKGSDQPAHMRSLIRAFACHFNILWLSIYWPNIIWSF